MVRMTIGVIGALALFVAASSEVLAQGIVIDRRTDRPIRGSYEVREMRVEGTVRDQVAELRISQTFFNPTHRTLEAEFMFPIPDGGAVQSFVLMVDGRELTGELMKKEDAKGIYESIVRAKKDPALLEYVGRGLLKTSVFPIPAGEKRTVTMRFTQLLGAERGRVELAYPLATYKLTGKPVERVVVDLAIESSKAIKSIYSPTHDIAIERKGADRASIRFEASHYAREGDFRLLFDAAEGEVGATVLTWKPEHGEDGYFLVLASPGVAKFEGEAPAKTVIFVLDKSGSMSGEKIEQARGALRFVLERLGNEDRFNIITYDDRIETFRDEVQRMNRETRTAAERFVDGIRAGGSTNIDEALRTAMSMAKKGDGPTYVLFLTDGLPTAGETNELKIAKGVTDANDNGARLIAFGVGDDVNARLIDRLARSNKGVSEYVRPNEDIEASVSRFASRLTAPVLSDVVVNIEGVDINRVYPRQMPDLFDGQQVVTVGRYVGSGEGRVRIIGTVRDNQRTFSYPATFSATDEVRRNGFIETLWATRRVGDLIDQIDLNGTNQELMDELLALSKRYGILTPYTAFLADENVRLGAIAEQRRSVAFSLEELEQTSGASNVAQRVAKNSFRETDRALAPSNDALQDAFALSASRAGGGGGARVNQASAALSSGRTRMAAAAARPVPATGPARLDASAVQRFGQLAVYRRDNLWIDSRLTEDDEAKAVTVERFTDRYFELIEKLPASDRGIVNLDESIIIRIDGTVYKIAAAELATATP